MKRILKRISFVFVLVMCLCVLLTGCNGEGKGSDVESSDAKESNEKESEATAYDGTMKADWEKPFDDFGGGEKYEAEVHTPEDILAANQEFLSKISVEEGIGKFKVTPLKYGEDVRDFYLIVENENDFPAGAYVTFVLKDSNGKIVSAGDNKTRVISPHDRDIIIGKLGDGCDAEFSKLEITPYIREGAGEGVYATLDKAGIIEVGNGKTGRGRRIDIHFEKAHGWVARDMAVFYDSDGNVYKVQGFVTTGDTDTSACIYTEFDYGSYEILAWERLEAAERLPEEIYAAYEKAGFESLPDTDYESLDSRIKYSFKKSEDGKLLLSCKNESDKSLAMRMDEYLVYDDSASKAPEKEDREYHWDVEKGQEVKAGTQIGEPAGEVWQLFLKPGEELMWDIGVPAEKRFFMLPFAGCETSLEEPIPEVKLDNEGEKLKAVVDWGNTDSEHEIHGVVTLVYREGDKIIAAESLPFDNDYTHHVEIEAKYAGKYDKVDSYVQYYYMVVPMAMY